MIDKPSGGKRRIDDLSHCGNPLMPFDFAPNSFSEKWFFPVRFASIKDAIYGIQKNPDCIMATWDMTSAYHHLCINHLHWGATGFAHKGRKYLSPRLNFGSQASPGRFNLYSEAIAEMIVNYFGENGSRLPKGGAYVIMCRALLDDFWAIFKRPEVTVWGDLGCAAEGRSAVMGDRPYAKAVAITKRAIDAFFAELGVVLNVGKGEVGFVIKYLGWVLDSKKLTIRCPDDKLAKIGALVDVINNSRYKKMPARLFAKFVGTLTWLSFGC